MPTRDNLTNKPLSFFQLAKKGTVVRNALKITLVVGSLLTLINHLNHFIAGNINATILLQIGLTYLVPYCVSTYSAVKALQAQMYSS